MRVVVQRSLESSVLVNKKIVGSINKGLVLLVGFAVDDTISDVEYLAKKVLNLRIFDDDFGVMNKSILDVGYSVLSVSQFTLYADTKKGNRPSYFKALQSDKAIVLYNKFNEILSKHVKVKTGIFKENMQVNIINDGPVTILLESR